MKKVAYLLLKIFNLILIISEAQADFSTQHPIYNRLIELQPRINKKLGMSISNAIHQCHKRIGFDKFILVSMYNQESSINYKAKNCLKGILENDALDEILRIVQLNADNVDHTKLRGELTNIPLRVCFDLGIGQINVNTALRHTQCSDLKRLITDYKYNISCSCKVLEDFQKRYAHKDAYWWTRYNASSPVKREIYRQLVMRYYPEKLEESLDENITQFKKAIR